MVDVAAFRAIEYDPARVDLAKVVCPPYDVIGPDELKHLRSQDPHNFVYLTKEPPPTRSKKKADWLEEVDRRLQEWLAQGVLRPLNDAILYAYECLYVHREQPRRLRGVLARLKVDPDYKSVLPHEEIFPKPMEERVKVLRATGVDLEPIQLLYSGKSAESTLWAYVDGSQKAPDFSVTGPDGAHHKFWRVSDVAVIATVVDGFKGRKAYIADGHHRYAAAVAYADERRRHEYRPPKDAAWEYKLAFLVNMADSGLQILPTHRVVKRAKTKGAALMERWSEHFDVQPIPTSTTHPIGDLLAAMDAVTDSPGPVLGAWLGEGGRAYVLRAKAPVLPEAMVHNKSTAWRALDVVFLQKLVLEQGMRVPTVKWGDDVYYTRSDEEAVKMMRGRKAVAVLCHRPTRLHQLRAVVDAGEKMPQKSTYFVPKILSGIALYPIGKRETAAAKRPKITS